jgi:RNA polymerase sigma-70 factor (ECF subfamily)
MARIAGLFLVSGDFRHDPRNNRTGPSVSSVMANLNSDFDTLVNALSPELYRYAMGLCHNRHTAEDLVQETFLRGWRSRDKLRDTKAARAWLYTILRNEHARLYERQRPDARDPSDLPDLPVHGYDTSSEAFVMRRALSRLEPDYRDPLLLQVIGGFSCNEIGQMLDLHTNTVLTRLFRARRALREQLTGQAKQEASQ